MTDAVLKIATYNQMFGFDGTSFRENFLAHFLLHGLGNFKAAVRRSDLRRTFPLLQNTQADVLGICEVLGPEQEATLRSFLRQQGYVSIHSQTGHQFKKQTAAVINIVATKMLSILQNMPQIALPKHMGFGGGFTWAFIPELKINVLNVHFALPFGKMRTAFLAQVKMIRELLSQKFPKGKTIIMGDFNCAYASILHELPELADFLRLSPDQPTCSLTPFLRLFFSKDVDHIFGKELTLLENGILPGYSDHALVWATVR